MFEREEFHSSLSFFGISLTMEFFIFILGLVFGSFANVCIYRIPNNISILSPASSCPGCANKIKWHDNIPIVSYVILAGKCRVCKNKIPLIYPLVELITAIVFLSVYRKFIYSDFSNQTIGIIFFLLFTWTLIVISGIDFYHRIIPDFFTYLLIGVGVLFSPLNDFLGHSVIGRIIASTSGAFAGLLFGISVSFIGEKAFKKEAFGGGDVKLMAAIGAFLGWLAVFKTLFVASMVGSFISIFLILLKRIKKSDYIPFGPLLSAGAFFVFLFLKPA